MSLAAAILYIIIFMIGVGVGAYVANLLLWTGVLNAGYGFETENCYECNRQVITLAGQCLAHPYQSANYYFCSAKCAADHHAQRSARLDQLTRHAEQSHAILARNYAELASTSEATLAEAMEPLHALAALPYEERAHLMAAIDKMRGINIAGDTYVGNLQATPSGRAWLALNSFFNAHQPLELANADQTDPA